MASEYTTNRRYPLYTNNDKPNLRDQYNGAIREIDSDMQQALNDSSGVASALGAGFDAQNTVRMAIDNCATDSDLANEVTARANADTALGTRITNETTARENADTSINNKIGSGFSASNTVANAIELINNEIGTLKGTGDVTKYGAVSGSHTNDWQSIFNACMNDGRSIFFPAGTWYIQGSYTINNPLLITADSPLIMENANSALNIQVAFSSRACVITGIVFNGLGTAKNALKFSSTSTNAAIIIGCSFIDFIESAIYSEALGLFVDGCIFHDNIVRNNESLPNRMIGITGLTDNVISNCKFFHQLCAIKVDDANNITNCYMYSAPHNTRVSYGIMTNTHKQLYTTNISFCEFDTITYCIDAISNCNVTNNVFMWDHGVNPINAIFYVSKNPEFIIDTSVFSNNTILGAASNTTTADTIQMYYLSANSTNARIRSYRSKENNFINRSAPSETVKLFAGLANNGGALDSSTAWQHYEVAFPQLSVYEGRINIKNNAYGIELLGFSSARKGAITPIPASYFHTPLMAIVNTTVFMGHGFYIRGGGTPVVNEISLYTGTAVWTEIGATVNSISESSIVVIDVQ